MHMVLRIWVEWAINSSFFPEKTLFYAIRNPVFRPEAGFLLWAVFICRVAKYQYF